MYKKTSQRRFLYALFITLFCIPAAKSQLTETQYKDLIYLYKVNNICQSEQRLLIKKLHQHLQKKIVSRDNIKKTILSGIPKKLRSKTIEIDIVKDVNTFLNNKKANLVIFVIDTIKKHFKTPRILDSQSYKTQTSNPPVSKINKKKKKKQLQQRIYEELHEYYSSLSKKEQDGAH